MKKRLLDSHPTQIAFNRLCQLANELDISIEYLGFRTLLKHAGKIYDMEDIEDEDSGVLSFPPVTEIKLTYER